MANIIGQIETLKRLREELNVRGIHRFNSVQEINDFLKNFEIEKKLIIQSVENDLEAEIESLKERIAKNKEESIRVKEIKEKENREIYNLDQKRLDYYKNDNDNSILARIYKSLVISFLEFKLKIIKENFEKKVSLSTKTIEKKIKVDSKILSVLIENKNNVIVDRSQKQIQQLYHMKEVVSELTPLIAGAVGENLVVKEINKLTDDYTLINDFSLTFDSPIYNSVKKERIKTIQIDHLLISKSGVFILETKNWSKNSIMSLDLRSPIEQIRRSSYALYRIINNGEINLSKHHWGDKNITIRNIIVMIKHKPKGDFKYVKIKTLKEINSYIQYFENVFSDYEYAEISNYLIDLHRKEYIYRN
jgi:hypothetical protein